MNADALRLASNRWGWDPQVDKEQQREAETGGPDGDGWFMDGEKRAEISVQERRESIKPQKQAAGPTLPPERLKLFVRKVQRELK